MARRGTPLAWSVRATIRQMLAEGNSRRKIAEALKLGRDTVNKYAKGT